MVVAKHDRAHVGLAGQFSVHSIERIYEAIVWGVPATAAGTVERPIGRHPVDRKRMAIVSRGGKRAVTHWRLLEAAGTRAARARVPRSRPGAPTRSGSIAASLGHPIVGDRLYGRGRGAAARPRSPSSDRIPLHARGWASSTRSPVPSCFFDVAAADRCSKRFLQLLRA